MLNRDSLRYVSGIMVYMSEGLGKATDAIVLGASDPRALIRVRGTDFMAAIPLNELLADNPQLYPEQIAKLREWERDAVEEAAETQKALQRARGVVKKK